MSGRKPELRDADLEALLRRRAARASLSTDDRERVVLAAASVTRRRDPHWHWPRALVPLAAALAVVVVVGSAILGTAQPPPSASPGATLPPGTPAATPALGTTAPATSGPSVSPATSAGATPSTAPGVRSLLYVELQQLLSDVRADGQERTVLADMQIDRKPSQFHDRPDCGGDGGCLIGTMPDADARLVPIFTTKSQRDSWGNNTAPVGGQFAIRLNGDATIDLLGFPWPAATGNVWRAHASLLRGVPQDVLVDGWLTGTAFPCPLAPENDQDTPFWSCANSWITQAPIPAGAPEDDRTFTSADGLPVQPSAYTTFAPDPVGNAIAPSRHGIYLLQHVTSTASWCGPCDAWKVLGRMTEGGLPVAGYSPRPTEPPLAQPSILSADGLRAAIASHKVAGAFTTDVVADLSIDVSQPPEPVERECQDPITRCNVVGTLQGFGPEDGVVVLRNDDYYPDLTFRNGSGPVALRLSTGPIQYLGHVAPASDGLAWSSTDAQAAQDSITPGNVLAVKGWLESVQTISCGPAPPPGPPLLPPFGCAIRDAITPTPVQTTFPMGPNGSQTVEPSEGLLVQMAAYRQFARDPYPALPAVRFGVYVVERVQNVNSNCNECHGWLVVGRLEPEGGSLTTANPRIVSPAELEAELAADRSSMVGRTVIVDGSVSPGEPVCRSGDPCDMGALAGTTEHVVATSANASYLIPGRTTDTEGRLALTVRADGLEWVGRLGYAEDNGVVVPLADLLTRRYVHENKGTLFVVRGWLVDDSGMSRPCPLLPSPVPSGTGGCQNSWITADRTLATDRPLDGALVVQSDAYRRFASDPAITPDSSPSSEPRFGSYLLRLVSNQFGATNWEVVSRLDP